MGELIIDPDYKTGIRAAPLTRKWDMTGGGTFDTRRSYLSTGIDIGV